MDLALRTDGQLNENSRSFLVSLKEFQKLVERYNFKVQTHNFRSLERFLALPASQRLKIEQDFHQSHAFLEQCSAANIDLRDNRELLRAFLKANGFIYHPDLLDSISNELVVEVYTRDQIQIFRNLTFMDLCSYTLLDLLIHEPYDLYERSEKVKEHLRRAVRNLTERPYSTELMDMSHVPRHVLREKFSEQRLASSAAFHFIAPLYSWPSREMSAFIAVQEGQNISDQPGCENLQFL